MRKAAKRDLTETEIIQGLELAGYSVLKISQGGLLDLLVCKHGQAWLVECKSRYGKLTPKQQEFMANWDGCPIIVAKTIEEVLEKLDELA